MNETFTKHPIASLLLIFYFGVHLGTDLYNIVDWAQKVTNQTRCPE